MRTKGIVLVLASALCGTLVVSRATATQNPPTSPPVVGRSTLGITVAETELVAKGWRVSKILGSEVRNDKGERIGKVDDIIVDSEGSLTTTILEVGGFLGMGGHRVAIPVRQLSMVQKKITLPGGSKDALKALPEFKYES